MRLRFILAKRTLRIFDFPGFRVTLAAPTAPSHLLRSGSVPAQLQQIGRILSESTASILFPLTKLIRFKPTTESRRSLMLLDSEGTNECSLFFYSLYGNCFVWFLFAAACLLPQPLQVAALGGVCNSGFTLNGLLATDKLLRGPELGSFYLAHIGTRGPAPPLRLQNHLHRGVPVIRQFVSDRCRGD